MELDEVRQKGIVKAKTLEKQSESRASSFEEFKNDIWVSVDSKSGEGIDGTSILIWIVIIIVGLFIYSKLGKKN